MRTQIEERKGKKKARELKVRCSFEPERLSAHYLKEAYEQLVPTATYAIVNGNAPAVSKPLSRSSNKEKAT